MLQAASILLLKPNCRPDKENQYSQIEYIRWYQAFPNVLDALSSKDNLGFREVPRPLQSPNLVIAL